MMDKRKRGIFPCYLAGMAGRNIPDAHRRRELIYMFFRMYIDLSLWPRMLSVTLEEKSRLHCPCNCSKTSPMKLGWGSYCCSRRVESCACAISVRRSPSPSPKISRHLAMLRESGLLLDRKQGKWVHYRLSPQMPAWAAQVIEQAWLSQQEDVRLMISRLAGGPGCR